MSWKPCRGHGTAITDAGERERKYRYMLYEYMSNTAVGFMEYSRTYYLWLVAERDCQKLLSPSTAKTIEQIYGSLISPSTLRSFEQHKQLCYKPLQKLMP